MHFPLCVGSMSVDSWIHWHPSSLLFTCYLGVPPLAESFCSDKVFLSILSRRSGTDPLKCPQSPGPSLPCLEGGRLKRTERTVRDMFKSKSECFIFECCWLTSHRDYNMTSLDCLDPVRDNEWPGASMFRKLNRGISITIYHTVSATLISVQSWIIAALAILQASNLC